MIKPVINSSLSTTTICTFTSPNPTSGELSRTRDKMPLIQGSKVALVTKARATHYDSFLDNLKKWASFEPVEEREKADIVIGDWLWDYG